MTVNVNLAGLPALVLPCGFAPAEGGAGRLPVGLQARPAAACACCIGLPVWPTSPLTPPPPPPPHNTHTMQLIGRAFGEADLLRMGHAFEQTADFAQGRPPVHAQN